MAKIVSFQYCPPVSNMINGEAYYVGASLYALTDTGHIYCANFKYDTGKMQAWQTVDDPEP
jgi:hypothetical protein